MVHEIFIERLKVVRPDIEVLGRYKNANVSLLVKCKKCGYEWNGIPANMLSGDGCRKCGTKKAHERFVKRFKS